MTQKNTLELGALRAGSPAEFAFPGIPELLSGQPLPCPACGGAETVSGTTSLWVTKDGGRTFRRYRIPGLIGYQPVRVRVSGSDVAISAKGFFRGSWRRKTVMLHAG